MTKCCVCAKNEASVCGTCAQMSEHSADVAWYVRRMGELHEDNARLRYEAKQAHREADDAIAKNGATLDAIASIVCPGGTLDDAEIIERVKRLREHVSELERAMLDAPAPPIEEP